MAYDQESPMVHESTMGVNVMDPELAEYLEAHPWQGHSYENTPLDKLRQSSLQLEQAAYHSFPTLGIEETILTIPMSDGYNSQIRVHKPNITCNSTPLVALVHGGGFTVGSNIQLTSFARTFASLYSVFVVLLSYRLAPEYKFPIGATDIWDSMVWLAANATTFGADPASGFVLGGVSAGANLAISAAHRSINHALHPPLTGLWTAIPPTTDGSNIPDSYKPLYTSMVKNANAPCLSAKDVTVLQKMLAPDPTSYLFSPFNNLCLFTGLPPTYVQVAGMDPLRDDGIIYERVARELGVQTKLDVYPGVPHGHFMYFPKLKQSAKFRSDVVMKVGWLLGRVPDAEKLRELVEKTGG